VRERGGPAGLILKGGRIVAEWGDTARTDMTFSIAKSYLSVLAGIAFDDGLIKDVDEAVGATVAGPVFSGAHNGQITWRHLLQQSSEWQGEIFGKSDQVDHNRQIGPGADNSRKGQRRELKTPGSFYEYNDVRVNVLSYALLERFRRPLPEVLRERVMDRSAPRRTGNGRATAPPSRISTDARSSRCRAAAIGAAGSSSARATMPASAC
jgi:CubicO group peptidase (beta-lactamase class C family)